MDSHRRSPGLIEFLQKINNNPRITDRVLKDGLAGEQLKKPFVKFNGRNQTTTQGTTILGKRTFSNRINPNLDQNYPGSKVPFNQFNQKYNSQDELEYEDDIGDVSNFEGLNIQIGLPDQE